MIADLRLQKFRSYADASFEFGPGVNIIVGPNGSGKTNLLEAILVLCRGDSYRGTNGDLIAHASKWARLDARVAGTARVVKLQTSQGTLNKQYDIGGTTLKRLHVARTVPAVVFEPNNLRLLTSSPELRRTFLDDLLEQTLPLFSQLRRTYKRTLAQRNSLLKQTLNGDQLFIWNVRLSECGGLIAGHRQAFINDNQTNLQLLYQKLAGKSAHVEFLYDSKISSVHYSSSLLKTLESQTVLDRERGFTGAGPHRDDFTIRLNGHSLATTASRGETRTMLLALKLLEVQSLEQARGKPPILLLDDVYSELDGARRQALTSHLQSHQTFITTTDADIVVQHFLDNCTVIPLSSPA